MDILYTLGRRQSSPEKKSRQTTRQTKGGGSQWLIRMTPSFAAHVHNGGGTGRYVGESPDLATLLGLSHGYSGPVCYVRRNWGGIWGGGGGL